MRPILATTSASTNWFDRFLRLSFFLGLVVLAFIGGFYACLFRVFPFDLLRNAAVAGQSLVEAEVPPRTEYATDLAVFDNLEGSGALDHPGQCEVRSISRSGLLALNEITVYWQ